MSEQYNELWDEAENNDDQGSQQQPSGGQLRDFAERTQAKNKELTDEVNKLRGQIRRSELSGALTEAGYDPAVIGLVPDSVTDKDGMNSWLEANGSFLNKTATPAQEPAEEEAATPETTLTDEERAAIDATSGAPTGVPPSASVSDLDRLNQAKSRDEYWQIMNEIQRNPQG